MTTNLFVIDNVKQLLTDCSFRILLPFFRTFWGVGVLNSAIFNSFHNRVEFGMILEGLRNFGGGGGVEHPNPPPLVCHCLQCSEGPLLCAYSEPDGSCTYVSFFLFFFLYFCGVICDTVNISG